MNVLSHLVVDVGVGGLQAEFLDGQVIEPYLIVDLVLLAVTICLEVVHADQWLQLGSDTVGG